MIKKTHFGYESYECSKCGTEVDQFDDYCQICGRQFQSNYIEAGATHNKFKALDYSDGDFNNKQIVIATLNNSIIGTKKFIVSSDSQIAKRVKYFVINGNSNFLEDGLMQDRLVDMEKFVKLRLNGDDYFVDTILL